MEMTGTTYTFESNGYTFRVDTETQTVRFTTFVAGCDYLDTAVSFSMSWQKFSQLASCIQHVNGIVSNLPDVLDAGGTNHDSEI